MPRRLEIRLVLLFLCVTWACAAFGQVSRSVRLVQITSTMNVPRPMRANPHPSAVVIPNETKLSIVKEGDVYKLNGQVVDPKLIASLVAALTAPANPGLHLDDLGVTPERLKEHAASAAQRVSESTDAGGGHVPQAALESTFADQTVMNEIIPELFEHRRSICADCAHSRVEVTVEVTFDDGSKLSASTSSDFPFMLPWVLSNATAYNASLSRAVAALMPDKSANRSLLLSDDFDMRLGRAAVPYALKLDVEHRTGNTFSALRTKYTIDAAYIGEFQDPALRAPEQPKVESSSVHFQLSRPDAPGIFFDDELVLPYTDGNVAGVDGFLQRAPQYEQLVLSVPWLNEFVKQNKRVVRPRLAFSHGVSLSNAAAQVFTNDMHLLGRDKLVAKTEAAQDQIALLIVGFGMEESDWLVFPDHHMVLWRYFQTPIYGKPDLLKWKPAEFPGRACAQTTAKFVSCVGTEVSPDGAFIAPE
jgi:hypothetical protein